MIIDCHTHLGRNEHITASVKELLESMDEAGIDKSLVFAGDLNDAPNNWVLEQVKSHHDRLKVVAAAHPLKWASYAEVERDASKLADLYQAADIVAVKFYTGYDHYLPSDRVAGAYLSHLEDVGCPAIFHMGDCLNSVKKAKLRFANPMNIDDVAVDYPKMNFIIAHMAYPFQREAAEVCYKNANVYTDISGFVYDDFKESDRIKFKKVINEVLDISSTDKLLFGTDWPIANQASYIDALDNCFGELLTPQSLTQNIVRAFNLKV